MAINTNVLYSKADAVDFYVNNNFTFPSAGYLVILECGRYQHTVVTVGGVAMTNYPNLIGNQSDLYVAKVNAGTYTVYLDKALYDIQIVVFENAANLLQVIRTTSYTNYWTGSITPQKGHSIAHFAYGKNQSWRTNTTGFTGTSGVLVENADTAAGGSGGDWWHVTAVASKSNAGTSTINTTGYSISSGTMTRLTWALEFEEAGGSNSVIWWFKKWLKEKKKEMFPTSELVYI
jgi:hypothetical protein